MTENNIYVELAARVALNLGVLALGIAAGSHISLMAVQNAIRGAGTAPLVVQSGSLYPALEAIQAAANTSAYAALALLLAGGLLTRRAAVRDWMEGVGGDA